MAPRNSVPRDDGEFPWKSRDHEKNRRGKQKRKRVPTGESKQQARTTKPYVHRGKSYYYGGP